MSVEAFIEAKARWMNWLDGDEHSINGQLSQLLWNDAVFRCFNELRRWARETGPTAAVAPMLAQFLDQGYVAAQIIGISKLVEWSNPKTPAKGVISLRRLVDDMMANHALLTRENYLAAERLPYDYRDLRDAALAKSFGSTKTGVTFDWVDVGDGSWGKAELFHQQFDRYAQVSETHRKPTDRIHQSVLDRLDKALASDVFDKIRAIRHKTVAHAADAYSRQQVNANPGGPSFLDVDSALKILLGVRQVAQAGILYDSWRAGAVPVPQHDQFQYLDLPFAAPGGVEKLQAFWHSQGEERDKWLHEAFDELAPPKF